VRCVNGDTLQRFHASHTDTGSSCGVLASHTVGPAVGYGNDLQSKLGFDSCSTGDTIPHPTFRIMNHKELFTVEDERVTPIQGPIHQRVVILNMFVTTP
jgi:hypothetical protein